jgi:hypothetical protein
MGDVTQMLISYGEGDRAALDALLPLVYDELRMIARSYLRQERSDWRDHAARLGAPVAPLLWRDECPVDDDDLRQFGPFRNTLPVSFHATSSVFLLPRL